jgi:anti-sigma factor RsiW
MSGYLDAELSSGRMEGHLAECDECRRLLAGLRAVLRGLHGLGGPLDAPDPARFAAAVRLRVGEGPR